MDKRDFAKLVLMGMAAGSLIGNQSLTADENEEANRGENFLAAAGCKGPGGCGGTEPPPQQYHHYTADNDTSGHGHGTSGYSQSGSYQGSTNSNPSSSYYNTGSTTTPSSSMTPTSTYNSGSTTSPSSSMTPTNTYNSGSTSNTSGTAGYQGSGSANQSNSYYNPGTSNSNFNRGANPSSSTPSQPQSGSMQQGSSSSSMNNPTAYPDNTRNSQHGRYLAAGANQEENIIASDEGEKDADLFAHEGGEDKHPDMLLADDSSSDDEKSLV